MNPTVRSLHCGHSYLTTSGNVSEHSTGTAVDIAAINGIPILGHQGKGSITDITIQRLLTLQGTMKPHQIISLMTFPGTDNTLSLPDHYNHIHVGFRPLYGANPAASKELWAILKPSQWDRLIQRLGQIDNPTVEPRPVGVGARDQPGRREQRRLTPKSVASASSSGSFRAGSARRPGAMSCAATRAMTSSRSSSSRGRGAAPPRRREPRDGPGDAGDRDRRRAVVGRRHRRGVAARRGGLR